MSKKTVIIIASCFIGGIVLLLIILWILSLTHHKYYSYEEVEQKMIAATESYYKKNPETLPVNDGKSNLSYSVLVENNEIKPLEELLEDGNDCSAEIIVVKSGTDYTYIPRLTCSDKYATVDLSNQVIKNSEIVTSGSGLYEDSNGGYYFRGKVDNNYVAFGIDSTNENEKRNAVIWRILSIDSDNSIRMIATKRYPEKTVFDDRYNEQREENTGYNDFENSILKDFLKKLETDNLFFNDEQLSKIEKRNLCIGARTDDDISKDGSSECSVKTIDKYAFDLLKQYEYLRISLDENCKNQTDRSCQNFNFLYGDVSSTWTLSPDITKTHKVYSFDGISFISSTASNEKSIFLVVNLSPYVTFKSGDGTATNPYRLVYSTSKAK